MSPSEGALGQVSLRERLLLPSPLQWAVRVGAVVLAGIVIFGALTQPVALWEQVLVLALGVGVTALVLMTHGRVEVSDEELRLGLLPFWRTTLALR